MRGVDMSSMSVWATVVVIVAVVAVLAIIIWAIVLLARGGKRKSREDGEEEDDAGGEKVEIETVYEGQRKRKTRDTVVKVTVETEKPARADPRKEKKPEAQAPAPGNAGTERKAAPDAGKAEEPYKAPTVTYEVPAGEAYEAASPLYGVTAAAEPAPAEDGSKGKTVKTLLISKNRKTGLWDVRVEGEDTPVQSFQTETEALTFSKRFTGGSDVRIVVERKKPETR